MSRSTAAWREAVPGPVTIEGAPTPSTRVARAPVTHLGLAGASLLLAIVVAQASLVALAAPFALAAVVGLIRRTPATLPVRVTVDRLATVEGDPVSVEVQLGGDVVVERLELVLDVDPVLASDPPAGVLRLTGGGARTVVLHVPCSRWGVGTIHAAVLRWRDPAGVVVRTARIDIGTVVRVLPGPEVVQTLVRTDETQLASGNAVARELGPGIEFGELRQYLPGDTLRSVNWRVSARRAGLWVTERHAERNVDVVLVVDAVLPSALTPAVRAAAALGETYLQERDRVGLLGIGGSLRWLRPGWGITQRHRLVEELIAAQAFALEVWGSGLEVPRHALPPGALVIALTSLLDDQSAGVLLDLRDRGFSLAVIEVGVLPESDHEDMTEALVARLWRLRRAARRDRLRARGVPVARWTYPEPLEAPMAKIAAFRRALRRPGS